MKLTAFQRNHRPVHRVENKCDGKPNANGLCDKCGREISRKVLHKPNITGALGYTLYWSNATSRKTDGTGKYI